MIGCDISSTMCDAARARAASPVAFADPEWVREVLAAAGFADVALEPHEASAHLGPDVDTAVQFVMGVNPATAGIPSARSSPLTCSPMSPTRCGPISPMPGVVTDSATWVVRTTNPP